MSNFNKKALTTLVLFTFPLLTVAQDFYLAPQEVDQKVSRIKEITPNYISGLYLFADPVINTSEKRQVISETVSNYFLNEEVMVYNAIEKDNDKIKYMKIKNYLEHISLMYSGEEKHEGGATFATKGNVKVYGPFKDASNSFKDANYFFKSEVTRKVECSWNKELSNISTLDFYYRITDQSNKIRIFSITKHKENANSFEKLPVKKKEIANSTQKQELDNSSKNEDSSTKGSVLQKSYVKFNIKPDVSDVYVDGNEVYYVNGMKTELNPGKRKIQVKAKGYSNETVEFNVKKGKVNKFNLKLTKEYGTVRFVCKRDKQQEKGAVVKINGEKKGTVPTKRVALQPGQYVATIEKNGYFRGKQKFEIKPEMDKVKKVRLINKENVKKGVNTTIQILDGVLGDD